MLEDSIAKRKNGGCLAGRRDEKQNTEPPTGNVRDKSKNVTSTNAVNK